MPRVEDLAHDVTVLILGGGRGTRLHPLTMHRSKPAVPIAAKYRLIDIPISNAINSHMQRMYVLTQFNSVSLHRHIGRTYRFDAFSSGYVQILAAQQTQEGSTWFQGTADAVRQNERAFSQIRGDFVLILAGDHLYRMDYRDLLADLMLHDADVAIGVMPCSEEAIAGFGAARVDEEGRILEFREKPKTAIDREGMEVSSALLEEQGVRADQPYLASMGIYLFRKHALLEALDNDFVDFGGEVIPAEVGRRRVQAHFFKDYWRDIGTIRAFFDAHMDLVKFNPPFSFHDRDWPIYTRPRHLPGARLDGCCFKHVLLGDGSRVIDAKVEDSVIGLRSNINGATLKRALVMGVDSYYPEAPGDAPPVGIGEDALIENAIIDKNARIGRGVRIVNTAGVQEADGDGWAIRDGIVVIPKNGIIPDGTEI
jgi:glucose-1-phosphate adenylyltransferase